jgi:hypothetical protein
MKFAKFPLGYFATLLLLLFSFPARATHIMGSDIQWTCQGQDTFLVTMSIYRDCNGISLSDQNFTVTDCNRISINITTTAKRVLVKDITPVCKRSCTRCGKTVNQYQGNPNCKLPYGIEMFVYSQKIILPDIKKNKCCAFIFSWSSCCRNGAITTGASSESYYAEGSVDRCHKPCDNSPMFLNPPMLIVCLNQCITINQGVIDNDVDAKGNPDSLVYSLDKPTTTDAKSYTSWSSSYSFDKPLKFDSFPKKSASWNPPSCAGFHLDISNGDLQFKPTKVEQTIMSIKVEEWAKDTSGKPYLKGYTHRDMQIVVTQCPGNHIPTLTGINGTNITDVNFCAGRLNCFTINSNDVDIKDTISISAQMAFLALSGATFKVETKKQHPRATLCWQPDTINIRSFPYQVLITAEDDVCPINGRTSRVFRIHVKPSEDDTFSVTQGPNCGDYTFSAFSKKGIKPIKAIWQGDDSLYSTSATFTHHYKKPGTYKYALITDFINGCGRSDSGIIVIPSGLLSATLAHDTSVCYGATLPLAVVAGSGHPPYHYKWSTGDTTALIKPLLTKDSLFTVSTSDSLCMINNSVRVKLWPTAARPSVVRIGKDSLGSSAYSRRYFWYRDSIILTDSTKIINSSIAGKYSVQLVDTNGCFTLISMPYTITGVVGNYSNGKLTVFPNPTSGLLSIDAPGIKEGDLSIQNALGEIILRSKFNAHKELDLHSLPKAIYFLKIQSREGILTERLILK